MAGGVFGVRKVMTFVGTDELPSGAAVFLGCKASTNMPPGSSIGAAAKAARETLAKWVQRSLMLPILHHFLQSDAILFRIRGESNANFNESRATCLDSGVFEANRGGSGNRQPKGAEYGINIWTAPVAALDR